MAHLKWLKFFIYLTDVTVETGAHSIALGSHKCDRLGRSLRRRGLVRYCDEDILATYGANRVLDIVGPKGTMFIADTRAFHKGQHPVSGDRLMLQLYYVN